MRKGLFQSLRNAFLSGLLGAGAAGRHLAGVQLAV